MNNPRLSLGAQLVLLIVRERHPDRVTEVELNDRMRELLREHGTVENALEAMKKRIRDMRVLP